MVRRYGVTLFAAALSVLAMGVRAGFAIEAITKPGADVTLSFVRPGRIAEVLVREGQQVDAGGQVLVKQDDSAEQAMLAQLEKKKDDTVRIRAAQAQLDQKKVDLKKIEWAAERGAATKLEVEHARLDVTIADLSLELARFEHKQDELKYDEVFLQVKRMRLVSPIKGRVEQIFAEEGESVDSLQNVIRIVQVDPLWVDVYVPLEESADLHVRQQAFVEFKKSQADKVTGEIIHVSSVADAASETLMVRVKVPNPQRRPAGERVDVGFEAAQADVSEPLDAAGDAGK
jgi:RND family efflux transporter MFP subunit